MIQTCHLLYAAWRVLVAHLPFPMSVAIEHTPQYMGFTFSFSPLRVGSLGGAAVPVVMIQPFCPQVVLSSMWHGAHSSWLALLLTVTVGDHLLISRSFSYVSGLNFQCLLITQGVVSEYLSACQKIF